jgi:hypothetical protein
LRRRSIVGQHGQTITVDRAAIVALVSALGAGFMERRFSLQQGTVTYDGCRIARVSGRTEGSIATIEFESEHPR